MSWLGDVINFLITSGILAIVVRYIKKEGGHNIFSKRFWTKEKYQELLKQEIERNTNLYKELDYFRNTFDLKSIDVLEFHNGDYINRKSIQKYTMTFQMMRVGVPETKHLYQNQPLEDHYGLLNLYRQSDSRVVIIDEEHIPKDAPPLLMEKMTQLRIKGYIALGLFKNREDIYPRAIISCSLDEKSNADGLEVELHMHEEKFKALILPSDDDETTS